MDTYLLTLFDRFYSIEELYKKGFQDIPDKKGIYIIIKPGNIDIIFSVDTTAIKEYKGKNLLYDLKELKDKYGNSDKKILYIGKAGGEINKLRGRIRQLIKYGYREADNHRGGRAIWQIENNKELLIGYSVCDNPREKEKELLQEYFKKNRTLPLANWSK